MATQNDTPAKHFMDALQYLASVCASMGGPQSSLPALESAKHTAEYWLLKVIDERIEMDKRS